ncbi:type I-E CRISPR-associated protein Cas6/Cse3/CasE [Streptomyces mobaraensis]|uniref:Type I-E CRISPR-associated protein Cas6/Cse3/CasE n=1 Tax=Streptomyces mobaraensis TaxID=35621 RepID=A0A5N5W1N4_STRMB|nr:type I-E CRISPR-associated protein Cas6/Cse3/CasE [Streptomyces mobaraensis]
MATPDDPGWDTRPYLPLLERLRPGARLYFRLTANPTYSTFNRGTRGTRTAHTTPTHQLRWLLDRAPAAGFIIPALPHPEQPEHHQVNVLAARRLDFPRRHGDRRPAHVRIHTVTYEGHLEITDPTALHRTLTHGLGRAKSYGCGLLTVAPTRADREARDSIQRREEAHP